MTTRTNPRAIPHIGFLVLLATAMFTGAQEPKQPTEPRATKKTDTEKLQGVWLFDRFRMHTHSNLGLVWTSILTIQDDRFTLTRVYDAEKPLSGKLVLHEDGKSVDFKLDEFDLTPVGMPAKLPVCTIPGLYKLDGDSLTLAVEFDLAGKRPIHFEASKKKDAVVTLRRAPKDFKAFPKDITVKAIGPDEKPVRGALVFGHMHQQQPTLELTDREGKKVSIDVLKAKPEDVEKLTAKLSDGLKAYVKNIVTPPAGTIVDKETGWTYFDAQKTTAEGTIKWDYEKLRFYPVLVRDEARKQMGVAAVSPWGLVQGDVVVKLQPECRVAVTGTCSDLEKAGGKNEDHFNCYIQTASGSRIGFNGNKNGKLEFVVPPGEYQLHMYGSEMMTSKTVPITVPANQSEYAAPPVDLGATGLHRLIGKPAPELTEIAGWKGAPVKLSDLKGNVVLLEFWGYWCGPCVGSMPDLFKIHDEFDGKGVVIVGVHVDIDGEVTTAKGLDDKLTEFRKDIWKGRDIPFSVAMTSGKIQENDARGGLANKYGIRGYPSTVLIDREGNVVGKFHARDAQAAISQLKKMLAEKK